MTPTQKREVQLWKIKRNMDAEHLLDARELPHQRESSGFRLSDMNDKELTFQPALNPLSVQIAAVRNSSSGMTNFGDRLYNESKTWRKKSTEQLKKKIDEEEMKECTFTPNVMKSTKTFHSALGYDVEKTARDDTPNRLSRWQEQRDLKISKMQHEKAAKVNVDCTFHPNVEGSSKIRQKKVPAGTGGPVNTRRRSISQQNYTEDRQRRASAAFYGRQERAQQTAEELRKALSPHKPLHLHPSLHSKVAAHVIANEQSEVIGSPIDQHLNRMVKARAEREMRRNSQLKNQLRNPWSVNGSTNPDLISVNADQAAVPTDHVVKAESKMTKSKKEQRYTHRALRPPVTPGDVQMLPMRIPISERVSPKSVPLPRF
jgi:hypothetical protein